MAIAANKLVYNRNELRRRYFYATDYHPHNSQKKLHDSTSRFRVMVAGRRWGKSLAAAKDAGAELALPGTIGWVVSKTYDLTWKVIREIVSDYIHKYRIMPIRSQRSGPIVFEFEFPGMGTSIIEGKSAEHPDSLLGEGLDWLIFDECAKCKPSIWEMYLRPALTDREGWALFITTPNGYNWVYDLWKRGSDPEHPDWSSFRSPSWENPHLSAADIAEAKHTLSEAAFAQEYGADFTLATGQVYKEFDEAYHVIPANELVLDPTWPRYRSIDFGYENPFVCLYITVDPEDRIIVYDEYYRRHATMEQHATALKDGISYQFTACDPSGASARATLTANGIATTCITSEVQKGIEDIRQKLRLREDGKPGLLVSSKCKETIKEFNLYSYPEEIKDKENPVKEHDHCMDALRYFKVNLHGGIKYRVIKRR